MTDKAPAPAPVAGTWRNPSGSVHIAIRPCGPKLCATVVAASDTAKADAARGGTRDLIGTRLFDGLTPAGPNRWTGRVYVPDLDRSFNGEVVLVNRTAVGVKGCVGRNQLCMDPRWTRVS
jgi:uncharacterized protein (DUF2147 family)